MEAIEVIREAAKLGFDYFDTADTYSNVLSEEILGKAIKGMDRSRIVIATKVFCPVFDDVSCLTCAGSRENLALINCIGLPRKHIFNAVDASLKRLDVDYLGLYQVHRLDRDTPMEEIMEALNDVVCSGKVRYIGASSMDAWEFQKLNRIAEKNGWVQFESMQNLDEEANNTIIDRVQEIIQKYSATSAQIALAWECTKLYVSSPIVDISHIEQLKDLIGALDVKLTKGDIKYLEEPHNPKKKLVV